MIRKEFIREAFPEENKPLATVAEIALRQFEDDQRQALVSLLDAAINQHKTPNETANEVLGLLRGEEK